jgi:hypothetical protein
MGNDKQKENDEAVAEVVPLAASRTSGFEVEGTR